MRDIYLIDFENVASEGLSGITYLAPEDEVIIFYSNNSKSLSMKMHILIGKSVCKLDYFEATVGGKNALDHQISTWLGYLVGTNAAERNYYIVSRDMGYKFVASFWADTPMKPNVRCVESIRAAGRIERSRQLQREAAARAAAAAVLEEQPPMLKPAEPVPMLHAAPTPQGEPPAAEVPAPEPVPAEAPVTEEPAPVPPAAEPTPVEPAAPEAPAPEVPETAEPQVPEETEPEAPESRSRRSRGRRSRSRSKGRMEAAPEQEQAEPVPQAEEPEPKPEPKPQPKQESKAEPKPQPKQEPKPEPKPEPKKEARHNAPRKKPEVQKEQNRLDLGSLIAPYPGLQEAHLQELINNNKRQVLCNTLRKQLGQEKGLALYNEIKKSAWR